MAIRGETFRRSFLAVLLLASLTFALNGESDRLKSLSRKVYCNCGCGDILAECAHAECKTKGPLKQEILSAVDGGMSDERILDLMGTKHGAAILVVPAFRGFNTLLWIVPVTVGLISIGALFVTRLRRSR